MSLNESIGEDADLTWLGEIVPQMVPGEPAAERDGFGEVVLMGRLRTAILRLGVGNLFVVPQ